LEAGGRIHLTKRIVICQYCEMAIHALQPSPSAIDELLGLMALATGDEKHDRSSASTLDVLYVLYEDVLRVDPADPGWDGRDRFLLSKGHGPVAYYAVLARKGFFPADELRRFL